MKTFGLFAKHPRPGKVKTRLATEVGDVAAATLSAAFIDDLTFRFRATGDRRIIGHAPREATRYFDQYRSLHYELWPQPDGELGEKIVSFFQHTFSAVAGSATPVMTASGGAGEGSDSEDTAERSLSSAQEVRTVLIGSDSPTLPIEYVEQAFEKLREVDCVLGPATDGGYYLIGLRRPIPALFEHIAWSGCHVLQQTVERAAQSNVTVGLLPPWYDIDDLADLQMLAGHIRGMTHAGWTHPCPMTAAALEQLHMLDGPGGQTRG